MTILTSTEGQADLPRYFTQVFAIVRKIKRGRLDVHLPDGRLFRVDGAQPGPVAVAHVHNADVFARLIRDGDLGFFEAYVDEWWSTPDLQTFFDFIHADNDTLLDGFPAMKLVGYYEKFRAWLQENTKRQAKKNIAAHYDLGNDFYRLWLDDTMTYSSGLFLTGQESLERAQEQKYASIVDRMGAKPGDHVLEIGCGWGGFAEYAATKRGLKVTALTISKQQYDYAQNRIAKAGLKDRVDIKLQDYRDERGSYDGIASIEMFEAVGQKYWPTYFNVLKNRLRPGKNATLQIITISDERWHTYRRGVDFIQKYIFPGGMLPSSRHLSKQTERVGLITRDIFSFSESYSITLRRWYERFNDEWETIAGLGFDARFQRMWELYLTSCAATFHSQDCNVVQVTVQKPS